MTPADTKKSFSHFFLFLMYRLQGPWFLLDCALQERSRGGCCHQGHVPAQGREVPQRRDCPQAGCCVHPLQWRCWPSRSGSFHQGSWRSVQMAQGCLQVLPGPSEQPEGQR